MLKPKKVLYRSLFIVLLFSLFALGTVSTTYAAAKLSNSKVSLLPGQTTTLKITGTTSRIKWKSSKPSVAAVNQNGLVSARKKGKATIQGTFGKRKLKCTVTVIQPVKSLALNRSSFTINPGETVSLKATVSPGNASNKKLIWRSSNPGIARVDAKGVVTGGHNGNVVITAQTTDGSNITVSFSVTVRIGHSNQDVTISSSQPSTNTRRFLTTLEGYSNIIEKEVLSGIDWRYSNRHPSKTFQEARANKNRITNCALMAVWGLKDIGVLSYKQGFWGESWGTIHYQGNGSKKTVSKKCNVIQMNDSIENLVAAGKLKSGDIIIYNYGPHGHTDVFLGYTAKTKTYHFYDAGRNGQNVAEGSDGVFHFSTLHYNITNGSSICAYVIRVK